MGQIKGQKRSYIIFLACRGFIIVFFPSEKAEAQTYNAIWITGLDASPNPMLSGIESTTITINTFEYAQWFWLYPSTMVRPTVIVWIAGRPFIANITYEWLSGIGFWGWWFYWWFNQVGTWTHQIQWDGKDLQGNLVTPGSYLATVNVYAGGASTFGSVVINVEEHGLFDINGDWQPPHSLHRRGESVDFSKYYKDSNGNNIEVVFYDENGNVIEITGVIDDRKLDEKFSDKKCARYERDIGLIHYECPR